MNRRPPTVLVVDDEPDTCANLKDILTDLDYDVDVAYDGQTALQLVARRNYDVALLDLRMPEMDGLELYRRIRALAAGTVAIIVTAYTSHETAEAASQLGVWRVVPKPVDFERLLPLVDEAAGRPLVLIVDDDSDLCLSLSDLFQEHGLRASLAHDVPAAEQQLRKAEHQVVLIDLKLPHGNGAQVFDLVRQINPQARTVLITGHRSEMSALVEQVQAAGADAICYKPFDVPRLIAMVQELAG